MIGHPTRMITQGAGIVKGWEAKEDQECIPYTFKYNKNDTTEDPLASPQMNLNSPYPKYYIYILSKSSHSRQHLKVLYR